MSYQIVFTSKADYDLNKIKVWYDQINHDLTKDLFFELGQEIDRIKKEPFIYQIRYREIRVGFLKRFDYGVHFMIKNQKNGNHACESNV